MPQKFITLPYPVREMLHKNVAFEPYTAYTKPHLIVSSSHSVGLPPLSANRIDLTGA